MATLRGLPDDFLAKLADDIETGEQVEALGRALEFSTAAINRYTETNRLEGRVTCKGTRDMLFDWRQTVVPSNQHLRLKEALINAKLIMLADTYLKDTPSISDIYNKKISESLSVKQCREKLKSKYLNSLCKIKMAPWDPNKYAEFKDMHTVITMVKKDAYGRDTGKKEILQGSVDEILTTELNGVLPRRILISAPAGRGKTTAVAKMAYDWANGVQGSSLENLPLLFVVKLRNTTKLTSIAEAIRSQLLNDVDDLTEKELHMFIKRNQNMCHIILDGLDEYAGIVRNQGLGSNIVDVMLSEEYPECRVLVTTRPHLENFFNQGELPMVYTKMFIEGFSRESSREYIDKFFASCVDPSKAQDLKVYLDRQSLINELVITPLFCLMVCHLWNEDLLGSDTKTQTELLDSVNVFLMHHANARSKPKNKITEDKLGEIICKLGKVALDGLLNDAKKLVFTPQDFRSIPAILDRACELGIISKATTHSKGLPKSYETASTTIEFYHKLAQEHSAGKNLSDQTYRFLMKFKISKLDRVLRKIRANIVEYENLIRFAAGTDNRLCIRIMEGILSNSFLDESERYRILLDCSSETSVTEGSVSSMVQRCVTAERMVLKSPTVYTVVGMQNLPEQLKSQIREVKFEGSSISTDVTSGLWTCLGSFPTLRNLTISDSSLSFPISTPVLSSVTNLVAKRVTPHSYEGLLPSLPGIEEIDITINDAERNIRHITVGLHGLSQTGRQQLTRIAVEAPTSLESEKRKVSRETMRGLGVWIKEQTNNLQMLALSGVNSGDEEDLVALIDCCKHAKALNCLLLLGCGSKRGGRLESYAEDVLSSKERLRVLISHEMDQLAIEKCQLSTEMTIRLWSSLRSFASVCQLFLADSSLSFPPSPPKLPSVTTMTVVRVTSQSYEGLLSSIPNVKEIDITVGSAENEDISQIQTSLRRHLTGQELTLIRLGEPHSLPSKESVSGMSREMMRGLGLHISMNGDVPYYEYQRATLLTCSGVVCGAVEETVIDLVQGSTRVMSSSLYSKQVSESMDPNRKAVNIVSLEISDCKLTAMITSSMWSCLRSFPSLGSLTISDSSLSFPPSPPELTSVKWLKAKRVTSQSYEGLLSSLPGLEVIDISIDDAERDISQITAGLRRTGGQPLRSINLQAQDSPPQKEKKKTVSRETMKGLGLLIREETKNLQRLGLFQVKCTDEDDLVDLIECCRQVKAMQYVTLKESGSKAGGRLESHLQRLHSLGDALAVAVTHEGHPVWHIFNISHIH